MKKLKLILPMLAIIFAIGMSFAFVNSTPEDYYVSGYVLIDNEPYPVEVNCNLQTQDDCLVEIEGLPDEFQVFDPLTGQPIKNGTGIIYQINDPRN